MMPAKKKQPKSAFYFFMLDVQEEIFRQSKMRPPMKELPAIASPRWTVSRSYNLFCSMFVVMYTGYETG